MFDISTYPLAWGDRKVKPDAFITGILRTTADLKKATLSVEMFTAADPAKLVKVAEFTFDTDLPLLATWASRSRCRAAGPGGKATTAAPSAAIEEVVDSGSKQDVPVPADDGTVKVDGIAYTMYSGGTVVAVTKKSEGDGAKMQLVSRPATKL